MSDKEGPGHTPTCICNRCLVSRGIVEIHHGPGEWLGRFVTKVQFHHKMKSAKNQPSEKIRLRQEIKELKELLKKIEIEHYILLRAGVEFESVLRLMEQFGYESVPAGEPVKDYNDRLHIAVRTLRDGLGLVRKRTGYTILRDGRFARQARALYGEEIG